ncbi:hypothetical protein [Paenibacillus cymbidii]|uniref:hypothetical protein n=1 Tax=Paenibacillus cymbidii TaxID=1639034 RepID=UPI0010822F3E|nr:hypothetical protein [Paenibacillus cymbidii]
MFNANKILGVVLMIGSVLLATIDRVSIRIAEAIIQSGDAPRGPTGERVYLIDGSYGILIYLMFFIGFLLLVAGFPGSVKRKSSNAVNER